jgi:hypothetical protein
MSPFTATPHPAPHSALRRLVARHPVAAFLVMVYVVNIAVALPAVRTHLAILPVNLILWSTLGHIFGSAVPAFLVVAAMHGQSKPRGSHLQQARGAPPPVDSSRARAR